MRAIGALVVVVLLAGCASTPPAPVAYLPEDRWVENEELPLHPRQESLPLGLEGTDEDVLAVEQGDAALFPGILVSERRAARDGLFRIRYEELRARVVADRQVWSTQRALYETQIQRDAAALHEAQPDFWEEHDFEFGVVLGLVIGGVVAIAATVVAE